MAFRCTAVPDGEWVTLVPLVKFTFPANVTTLERAAIIEYNRCL